MANKKMKEISIYPNLVRFAESKDHYDMFECIENCAEMVDTFLKSNKKADFEEAVDYLNYTLNVIHMLSESGKIVDQEIIDIIHDFMLLPLYILQYTAEKNETKKRIK